MASIILFRCYMELVVVGFPTDQGPALDAGIKIVKDALRHPDGMDKMTRALMGTGMPVRFRRMKLWKIFKEKDVKYAEINLWLETPEPNKGPQMCVKLRQVGDDWVGDEITQGLCSGD